MKESVKGSRNISVAGVGEGPKVRYRESGDKAYYLPSPWRRPFEGCQEPWAGVLGSDELWDLSLPLSFMKCLGSASHPLAMV